MPGPLHVFAAVLLATGVTGCTLLDLLIGEPPPFDPSATFPIPTAEATFTTGRATIEVGGETIVLDELAGASGVDVVLGTHVVWENDEGWYMSLIAYPGATPFLGGAYLSLDRLADNEHWVLADPTRCVTTTDLADASGVKGSATCRGLRWADYFSSYSGTGFPQPLPSQAPFDAEITFEAH